jgi:mediator of RNA polymerase II transcription subunit 19, fungi type
MPSMSDNNPLYLVDSAKHQLSNPSGANNLTTLYGLSSLAASVARFDPVTGERRKLRKSYKNHIADLPGKHSVPPALNASSDTAPSEWSLLRVASMPPRYDSSANTMPDLRPLLDAEKLNENINFDKTPASGVPDFDVSLLAIPFGPSSNIARSVSPEENGGVANKKNGVVHGVGTAESSNDDSMSFRKLKKKRTGQFEDGGRRKKR